MKGQLTQLVTRLCFIHAVGYLYLYLMAFAVHTGLGMFAFKFYVIYQETGFSLRILVAGERCNITGKYFESGSMLEQKIVIGYQMFAGEFFVVNGEFSDL